MKNVPRRNDTSDELTPKQEAAAVALASGSTYDQAAEASGAAAPTIKTWASTVPAFKERVRALTAEFAAELSARLLGRMTMGMMTALDCLERLCRSGKTESTQLKAAETLLARGLELTEVRDLKARMDELEASRR